MKCYLQIIVRVVLCIYAGSSWAQVPAENKPLPVNQDEYRDVAGQLRCPTCTGLSVLDSDAPFSVQIKNEVKEQLVQGKSEKDILKFFQDRYGPWILRSPPVAGVNALAWIIPIASMLLGPVLIWFFIGRRRTSLQAHARSRETVRSTESIVVEMKERLESLKAKREAP